MGTLAWIEPRWPESHEYRPIPWDHPQIGSWVALIGENAFRRSARKGDYPEPERPCHECLGDGNRLRVGGYSEHFTYPSDAIHQNFTEGEVRA